MKASKTGDGVYIYVERAEIKPFMLLLAQKLFQDDDFYICAIVLLNEFELHPTEENYQRLMDKLNIEHLVHKMEGHNALQFSDDLVDVIFPREVRLEAHPSAKQPAVQPTLKLARICGFCGDGYIAEKRGHDECVLPPGFR